MDETTLPNPNDVAVGQDPETVIDVSELGQGVPDLPQTQQLTPQAAINNLAERQLQTIQEQDQTLDQRDDLSTDIAQSIAELAGESEFRTQATQQFDIAGERKRLQALNNRILTLNAEIQQDDIVLATKLEGIEDQDYLGFIKDVKISDTSKRAALFRALKTSEIGVLNAQVLAQQGNIALAQQQVEEAVDAKYAPIREELTIKQAQLEALSPLFDRAEKKQAMAQERLYNLELRKIEEKKEKEKNIQSLGLTASGFGAPEDVVSNILNSKTFVEAINAAGKYTSDPLDRILKNKSIEEKELAISKITAEINKLNQPITIPTVANTTKEKVKKYMNSALNKNDLTAGERNSLSKAMTVVDQLDSLENQINEVNTGFFSGRITGLLSKFAGDVDAATIQAGLQAIIPNLARGVFGEVGVLTNEDIENYKKTVPNLTSTEEQNDAILALVLKTVINSVENQLDAASNSNVNVSGWVGDYQAMVEQVHEIEDRIGVSKAKVDTIWQENPDKHDMIMELFNAGASDREVLEILEAQ